MQFFVHFVQKMTAARLAMKKNAKIENTNNLHRNKIVLLQDKRIKYQIKHCQCFKEKLYNAQTL